jgi:hypothetical protein
MHSVSYRVFQPVSCAMAIFVAATAPPELRPENVTDNHLDKRPIEPECPLLRRDWCNEGCSLPPPTPQHADRQITVVASSERLRTRLYISCAHVRGDTALPARSYDVRTAGNSAVARRLGQGQAHSWAVEYAPLPSHRYLESYICLLAAVRQPAWPFQSFFSSCPAGACAAEARKAELHEHRSMITKMWLDRPREDPYMSLHPGFQTPWPRVLYALCDSTRF